jgi:hypothetical protein
MGGYLGCEVINNHGEEVKTTWRHLFGSKSMRSSSVTQSNPEHCYAQSRGSGAAKGITHQNRRI